MLSFDNNQIEKLFPGLDKIMQGYTGSSNSEASLWGTCLPVPKCVLDCSQGLAGRGCHSLKEDPLRNFLIYGLEIGNNEEFVPILGVLYQSLGPLVLGLWLLLLGLGPLHFGLGLLHFVLGLLCSDLGLLWSVPALASYSWSLAPFVASVAFVIHFILSLKSLI
ncbi:hypothetical protein DSO57_1000144 [Entomophthora muscae]|uniref:Uncharacterized protein n=1 Tax=Entomophthora muscae TaxID=34485 RepID=A0ACC2T8Z1_9FUNG|nr:hypothetical protein DSO57_1000144 [Entomophthora muscae]